MKKLLAIFALLFSLSGKAQTRDTLRFPDTVSVEKNVSYSYGLRIETVKTVIRESPKAWSPKEIAEARKKDRKTLWATLGIFVVGVTAMMVQW